MASPALDYSYRYASMSAIDVSSNSPRLRLATFGGVDENPYFFRGELRQPRRVADLLRSLMEIVHARFHLPGIIVRRLADPVVTSSEGALRFEGFSNCCSAYARVDLLPESVRGDVVGRGTTNVDFNAPMCAALAKVRSADQVYLSVGQDAVELSRNKESVVERKVALPIRWLKGFVEVQAFSARMTPRLELSGIEAHRFFRALPRANVKSAWIVPAGKGLRLSQRETQNSVRIVGGERLRTLENLAQQARRLRIHFDESTGASGWELDLPDCRFHLLLSPEVWRGFSGEGQVLREIANESWKEILPRVRAALTWDASIDAAALARKVKAPTERISQALAALGARGLVGFDLAAGQYFQRVLPFDLSLVDALQPRLLDARKLIANGAVRILSKTEDIIEAGVAGTDVEHRVRLSDAGSRCTCPWFAKHRNERGPCKHILAVQIASDEAANSR